MSNTIKLKRGSGSDPSASDLAVGEVALRTDLGKLFTKKDNGNVAEIGGSGISDGDKGDITVSNSGDTFTIDNGVISTAKIADNAVELTKIQDILTSRIIGRSSSGTGNPQQLTAANVRSIINVEDGATADQSASEILTLLKTVDGSGSGLVAERVTVTDNSSDTSCFVLFTQGATGDQLPHSGSNLTFNASSGLLTATSLSGILSNGVTATTQSASDNSTKVATTAYTDTAIANLVDSAPGTLNTLNELAAALGDDANFSTTVTNSIATKMPLAGGTFSGSVSFGDNEITNVHSIALDSIKGDADDNTSINFAGSDTINIKPAGTTRLAINTSGISITGAMTATGNLTASGTQSTISGNLDVGAGLDVTGNVTITGNITASGGQLTLENGNEEQIHRFFSNSSDSDIASLLSGSNFGTVVEGANNGHHVIALRDNDAADSFAIVSGSGNFQTDTTYDKLVARFRANGNTEINGDITVSGTVDGRDVASDGSKLDGIESGATADQSASEILTLIKTVDGAGSGLDADTVDGIAGGSFLRGDVDDTTVAHLNFNRSIDNKFSLSGSNNPFFDLNEGSTQKARFQWSESGYIWIQNHEDNSVLIIRDNLGFSPDAGSTIHSIFHAGNDGAGSGLDADLLDGVQGASYVRSDANDSITGHLTITNDSGLKVRSSTNGNGAVINFSDHASSSYSQNGSLTYKHSDGAVTTTGGNSNDGWLFEGSETRTVVKVVGDIEASEDIFGQILTLNASTNQKLLLQGSTHPYIHFFEGTTGKAFIQWHADGYIRIKNDEDGATIRVKDNLEFSTDDSTFYKIWHAGNDGSGSGLDADTLDGQHGSHYLNYNNLSNRPTIPTNNNQLTNGAGYITSASFSDVAGGGTFTGDIALSGGAGAMTVNANSDIRFTNGTWSGNATKIQHHSNYLYIVGGSSGIIFREGGNDRAIIDGSGHLRPGANNTYDLGTTSFKWKNIYTNDLNLSNEDSANDVDGTWGSYTIQEGAEDLFLINKRSGKKYKFMLQEVS